MKERKETISIATANVWAIVLLLVAAIVGMLYYFLVRGAEGCKTDFSSGFDLGMPAWLSPFVWLLLFVVLMMSGTVLHEVVHGLVWARYAKGGWSTISFGVMWKYLAPYCHCSVPLLVPHYRRGALAPLFVVGVLPLLISPFIHSIPLLCLGIFFIAGASGDLMVVWRLRKENPTSMVLDHPSEAGYLVYEEEGGEFKVHSS